MRSEDHKGTRIPGENASASTHQTTGPLKRQCPCKECKAIGGRQCTAKVIRRHLEKQSLREQRAERRIRQLTAGANASVNSINGASSSMIPSSVMLDVNADLRAEDPVSEDPDPIEYDDDPMQVYDWLGGDFHYVPLSRSPTPPPELDASYNTLELSEDEHLDSDAGGISDLDLEDMHDGPDYDELPSAFYEHPRIRNIYIRVFLESAFNHCTEESIKSQLDTHYDNLVAQVDDTGIPIPGLDRMARTLRALERRLGVNADQYVSKYFLCPSCWHLYRWAELDTLRAPQCVEEFCDGIVWTLKKLARCRKRMPLKVLPTCPLVPQLRRILQRPGKYAELQQWRGQDDQPGRASPIPTDNWEAVQDPHAHMTDIWDGSAWRAAKAGINRFVRPDSIEDVDVKTLNQRFVSLPLGLMLMASIDWFAIDNTRKHSSGALYVTICNNPREKRFRREETILACMIPGPHEPSLEQLNHILTPFVEDLLRLNQGVLFKIYKQPAPVLGHALLHLESSDLPASRKLVGLRSVTCQKWMCSQCDKPLPSLTDPSCFDPATFVPRDEQPFLDHSAEARHAFAAERAEIADEHGVRWSELNRLPGWLPVQKSPLEFMHSTFLGNAKQIVQGIIVGGGLLTARSRQDNPLKRLEAFLEDIVWPASVGRVPSKINQGSLKADQWRNLMAVLPVAIYAAWEKDGEIPDQNAPQPRRATKAAQAAKSKENLVKARRRTHISLDPETTADDLADASLLTMDRNYRRHYYNILEQATAIRIWASRTITPHEARRAQDAHNRSCQSWALMNCHLTPNLHLSCHNADVIARYGPVYGWWGYPMEQNNGFLKRLKNNGHAGGEVELTMLRGWIKYSLVSDLLLNMENIEDADDRDLKIQQELRAHLGRGSKGTRRRGSIMSLTASLDLCSAMVRLPPHHQKINLAGSQYSLVFRYLQNIWADTVRLIPERAPPTHGSERFSGMGINSYTSVIVRNLRYGVAHKARGTGYCFGYIEDRQPVRILSIFHVTHRRRDPDSLPLEHTCAVIQRFIQDDNIPVMPWDTRAIDLGISTWYSRVGEKEVVAVTAFSGHFARATIKHRDNRYHVTISLCHDGEEPYEADEDQDAYQENEGDEEDNVEDTMMGDGLRAREWFEGNAENA